MAVRTQFPSTRRFGGKEYQLRHWNQGKAEARGSAAVIRKRGASARVVKEKYGGYSVYRRG